MPGDVSPATPEAGDTPRTLSSPHSNTPRDTVTPRRVGFVLAIVSGLALTACGSSSDRVTAVGASVLARWTPASHVRRVLDLSAPRRHLAITVATAGHLALLGPEGALRPFARGAGGYSSPGGEEPYIALSSGRRVPTAGCRFAADTVYVLRLSAHPGVTAVDAQGRARALASLPAHGLENGIAFDEDGRFENRLLVTATAGSRTSVYAIDCRGAVSTVTRNAPKLEGGIAVAPQTFGRFAGDLIAPDENSGRIYAIAPDGRSRLLAVSGLPHGGDVGVESEGFVPHRFAAGWSALVADRLTPGNPHPGDDVILRIDARALAAAGVRAGDLLVATEGGAYTDAIACAASCAVRHVADGPAVAHLEGHITITAAG
jgi:hypothetical protein